MPKVDVLMDGGGAIRQKGSDDFLFTSDFGGCTAIYAYTDKGLYGLYHLRSPRDDEPSVVENAKDSNEPFRNWVGALKGQAQGEKIHFSIGTPWLMGKQKDVLQSHPELGMERYIRKLCTQHDIKDYDITLMNMIGVKSIAVNENGMACYGGNNLPIHINPAEFQTDEAIFEHSGLTAEQCLNYIKSTPNIDFDGTLQEKYQKQFDKELMVSKQKEMKAKLLEIEDVKQQKIKALRDPVFMTVVEMIDKYEKLFDQKQQGDETASHNYEFVKALFKAVKSMDLDTLVALKKLPYFNQVTEIKSQKFILVHIEKTELGKLFDEAEKALTEIQNINTDDADNVADFEKEASIQQGANIFH